MIWLLVLLTALIVFMTLALLYASARQIFDDADKGLFL